MDIKRILWICFTFFILSIIFMAITTQVRTQITTMNQNVNQFPTTQHVSY